jgi:hypothetical protein
MPALDQLISTPRLLEIDDVTIAAPLASVWEAVRHGELASAPLIRALFALRTLPDRLAGAEPGRASIRIDALRSTPAQPGFQLLIDNSAEELAVGAVGQVWKPQIPFVHVSDAAGFANYHEAGFVKVAWALQVDAIDADRTRLALELRVDATDEAAWTDFSRYFLLIGPVSRFIRRAALASLRRSLEAARDRLPPLGLSGDELLPDAQAEITHEIVIHAAPAVIWPWLVQMGCDRAGFYSIDALDRGGVRSAREIHPEWQNLALGQRIAATPEADAHFEVLRLDAPHTLVLGGLFDTSARRTLPFQVQRPEHYWHVTWAFVLRQEAEQTTRLYVRARAAFTADSAVHAAWLKPVHDLMEKAQLHNLRARAEGSLARDDAYDVLEGIGGALRIAFELITPFQRARHTRWGLGAEAANASFPGDELVPQPDWSWTHAIDIDASAAQVWPWLAQIGAKRAGFYSYQWLENLAGCDIRNAEVIHPEWQLRRGDEFHLYPKAPPLEVVLLEPGRWFVVHAGSAASGGEPRQGARVSWLFLVEPTGPERCRVISRFRSAVSKDVQSQLLFGPALLRPVGFAMDRRMLLGIKERAERADTT